MFLVQPGVNNVVVQQEKVALKVTTHRLVFEYANSTPESCQGKSVDFIPFWYMSAIETVVLSKGKTLLQFALRDFSSTSIVLPNATEAKAITQVYYEVVNSYFGSSLKGGHRKELPSPR